ncbi:MAG: FAD-dependent oxidoreductase [Rubrivivax sp.]|jgi:pyridine nucleotide-disulfide oxidoreductase family protein|nr:FAD-dependent oxidoreductase [Rubrivivax sp.]
MKRLVLLGGGHAHLHVLQALAREPLAGAQAVLITPHGHLSYSGMVPGVVAGHYAPEQARIPLAPLCAAAHVTLVQGQAVALDAAQRLVTLSDGRVAEYDVLSLDVGGAQDRDALPGAREHALFVRPIETLVSVLDRLREQASRRALDVVVAGAGAAGFELALALAWGLAHLTRPGDGSSRVALVTGGTQPLAGYPTAVVAQGLKALARHKVTLFREACTAVEPGALVLASGARLACDVPVIATGVGPPAWLGASGLALDERGFVSTGPTLQSTSHPEVLAAGDVASRWDAPHPRSGVHAVRAGPPLALNLRRFIGAGQLQAYTPQRRTLNLLSCGERRAIMAWGDWVAEGRWAWWWKDRIDRAFIRRFAPPDPVA